MQPLRIPLRARFEHAGADRSSGDSVLVRIVDTQGVEGLGEGCPRSHVSGETVDTCLGFFRRHRDRFRDLADVESLIQWIGQNRREIDANPAAFCAMETAWLDYETRRCGTTLESLLGLPRLRGTFRYSAILGSRRADRFAAQLKNYVAREFVDYKVKLFGDPHIDQPNVRAVREALKSPDGLRFDANNRWDNAADAADHVTRLDIAQYPLEEPLKPADFDAMRLLQDRMDARIILDESCRSQDDLATLVRDPHRWIINIRISRMGGLLRSLEYARVAGEAGIPLVVGAQVGETSLLTRAALAVANTFRQNLMAQEGAFGTHLLEYDIVSPSLMFGQGGLLSAERAARWVRG